jgi:aspartate/methionine/tyrosine aminotransferase
MATALAPFALERYFARYEFHTRHLLCTSDCESMSIGELLALEEGAAEGFQRQWLGYTESTGSPALRAGIARLTENLGPDDVLVHAGAEEAIFLFMHALLSPGDHIVVHEPCYQSLHEVARSLGCVVTPWQAREENGWALDLDELLRLLRPGTKAIVINTPHNPTGFLMPREDFTRLVRLAEDRGIVLFSDEVYRGLERDPGLRLPAACDIGEKAVSLGVMSKAYGLAGLRIGWVATRNAALRARMAALKDYTTICSSAPSEYLAELALRHGPSIMERNTAILFANMVVMERLFAGHPDLFSWVPPIAGPVAFPRFRGGDVEPFCDSLVRRAGVLLLPGTVFGDAGNHFRIGLGRRSLPEAAAALEKELGA